MNTTRGWLGKFAAVVAVTVLAVPMVNAALLDAAGAQAGPRAGHAVGVVDAQEATPTAEPMEGCGGQLSSGGEVAGVLDYPGAECYYTFEGSTGGLVTLSMERAGGDLVPEIALLAPDGSEVAISQLDENDDGRASLRYTLPESGTYTVVARSVDYETSGAFTLRLMMFIYYVAPACGGNISYGQSRTGLAGGDLGLSCRFTFSGRTGDVVTIQLASTDGALDPMVALYSPSDADNPEAENDDALGTDSLIFHHALGETGTYTIVASAYDGEGDFELALSEDWFRFGQSLQVIYPTLPLRRTAGYKGKPGSDIVGQVSKGALVRVLSGPVFKDGLVWYRVQANQQKVGWAPEVDVRGRLIFAP